MKIKFNLLKPNNFGAKTASITAFFLFVLTHFINMAVYSQHAFFHGYVYDSISHEPLIGAVLFCADNQTGSVTDKNGFFTMKVSSHDSFACTVSYLGYVPEKIIFNPSADTLQTIYLSPGIHLKEVNVFAKKMAGENAGMNLISPKNIKALPTLTGEPDLIKSIQRLPGVQMGDEGSSAINVRGGSYDQNLFLIDNVPLYYLNHLGGFVSVFDVNIINKTQFYKSDIPA